MSGLYARSQLNVKIVAEWLSQHVVEHYHEAGALNDFLSQ